MTAADNSVKRSNASKTARQSARKSQSASAEESATGDNVRQLPTKPPSVPAEGDRYESHWLGDVEYRQYPNALCGVDRSTDDKERPYPVLPGQLSVDRIVDIADIDRDGAPGDLQDTNYHVTYTPPRSRARQATISDDDTRERQPSWPKASGIGSRVASKKLDQVVNAMKSMSLTSERDGLREEGYAATGLLHRPGEVPVFLRQNAPALTPTGIEPGAITELQGGLAEEAGPRALALDDPTSPEQLPEDLLSLLGLLDVLPQQPYIPLALLGQLMWAPWSSDDNLGRFAIMLAGESGLRKTALMGASVIAAQSRFYDGGGDGQEPPVTVAARNGSSSVIGTDRYLYPLRGMVAVVDDLFAGQQSGKEIAESWKYLSSIANNATTGAGGAKGSRVGNAVRTSRYPRGCPVFTAEEMPNEDQHASEANRTAAFKLDTAMNLDALTALQDNPRALSRAHATMIQRGLSDMQAPYRALAWASEEVRGWNVAGHNRAKAIYSKILAGLKLYGEHLRTSCEMDPAPLLSEWSDSLAYAADQQAHRCGMSRGVQDARDHVRLFTRHLLALLDEDARIYAADPVKQPGDPQLGTAATYRPPEIEGHSPGVVGWRQVAGSWAPATPGEPVGAVYVDAGTGRPGWRPVTLRMRARRFSEVYDLIKARVSSVEGWPMPSEQTMRAKLVNAGYLKEQNTNVWSDATAVRAVVLDFGAMLDSGDSELGDDDDGGGGGGSPVDPEPTGPTPAEAATPGPEPEPMYCMVCGDVMTVTHEGQLTHPTCEPDNEYDQTDEHSGQDTETQPDCAGQTESSVPGQSADSGDQADADVDPVQVAVLDVDGLHRVIGQGPAPVDLDGITGLADLYRLALSWQVKHLWIHPRACTHWELPTTQDRSADISFAAGIEHEFAVLDDPELSADPNGLAPWINIWRGDDRSATTRSFVLPSQDDRMTMWATAETGAVLLEAVTRWSSALDQDYYWSVNTAIRQFVNQHSNTVKPNRAIMTGQVPPAVVQDGHGKPDPVFTQPVFSRRSRALSDEEDGHVFVHRFDLNAAEMAGLKAPLGNDEAPEHLGSITFDAARHRTMAGYLQLEHAPSLLALLPEWRFEPDAQGRVWVAMPHAVLLDDLGVLPPIADAWLWTRSIRSLDATYTHLSRARNALLAERDTASGEIAWQAFKPMYTNLIGCLASTQGPRHDQDGFYRPDWRDMIQAQTYSNMYRQLAKIGRETGRYPIGMQRDAVFYTSGEYDPHAAAPEALKLGTGLGQWKPEGCVPLAAVREYCGEDEFVRAFNDEIKRREV